MSEVYKVGADTRAVNALFYRLARWGRGAPYLQVLTVIGRTSGREQSVPVNVMEADGVRYLVAPYGEVNWVHNLRAAGKARLQRGSNAQTYDATEVPPADAVSVIREYVRMVPFTKDYWNSHADSTADDVLQDARTHPVFQLRASVTPPDSPRMETGAAR